MAAIILCESTAALTWFLERSRLSVVYPGAVASAFPRDLVARIKHVGENIGMAVASLWVLNSHLERAGGSTADPASPDEPLIFNGGQLAWQGQQRSKGRNGPLVDVLAQFMVRGYAEEQRQQLRNEFVKRLRTLADEVRSGRGKAHAPPPAPSGPHLNPYEILGVSPEASRQEIRTAWKARVLEYHPDRVVGLGKKLQQVAAEETLKINLAYEMIKKKK